MIDFTEKYKKLWNKWEIRSFVLCSLVIQMLLILSAALRKKKASRRVTAFVWSLYLLADWVAAFSLGLLCDSQGDSNCNNSSNTTNKRSSSSIFSSSNYRDSDKKIDLTAFWAPFLLLHLGGPDTITAFSLEDNELWIRHLLGLFVELAAAMFVFVRTLPRNGLLVPTLLMFLVGIIKYGERTFSLYYASNDGFRDSMLTEADPGPNYAKLMDEYTSRLEAGIPARIEITNESTATSKFESNETLLSTAKVEEVEEGPELEVKGVAAVQSAHRFFNIFKGLIVGLMFSFRERQESRSFFIKRSTNEAYRVVEIELGFVYEVLYTKAKMIHDLRGYVLRMVCSVAILGSFWFFFIFEKQGLSKFDVILTYALLIGAISLDLIALVMLISSDWTIVSLKNSERLKSVASTILPYWPNINKPRWSGKISQCNLINLCLKISPPFNLINISPICLHTIMDKIADNLGLKDQLDELLYTERVLIPQELKEFIFSELKNKSKEAGDYEAIKDICSCRGEKALARWNCEGKVGWSIKDTEFDESLLLWHIATDLCLWHKDLTSKIEQGGENGENGKYIYEPSPGTEEDGNNKKKSSRETKKRNTLWKIRCLSFGENNAVDEVPEQSPKAEEDFRKEMSKRLSDYMLYLLVMLPTMMSSMAGIGLIRYRDTCAEARRFFERGSPIPNATVACENLLLVNTETKPKAVKGDRSKSVLFDAVILAKSLNEIKEDKWKVISEVWVEMLLYAANHCNGRAHAQRLSKGGELLTIVWFLMSHLGLGEQYRVASGHARAKLIVEK